MLTEVSVRVGNARHDALNQTDVLKDADEAVDIQRLECVREKSIALLVAIHRLLVLSSREFVP